LSAVLAGFLNSFPDTAFAENVGLVGLTRVRSRWVVTDDGVSGGRDKVDVPGHAGGGGDRHF
jgi:hypothetical protein